MAVAMKIKAEPREGVGTSFSRRIRRDGTIPAVIYGVGKTPQSLKVNTRDFTRSLQTHASEHLIVDLEVAEGDVRKVLLQEVQHHPVTGAIIHADFQEISMTKKLRVEVPVHLVGDPVGVTQQGGVLEHLVREVEIECLPADIPEYLELDVSPLNIGHGLKAGEIKLDAAKYRLVTDPGLAVASVSAQRAEDEVAAAPAEGAAAEPEVLREKKEEGGEAAEGGKGEAKAAGGKAEAKPAAAAGAKTEAKPAKK